MGNFQLFHGCGVHAHVNSFHIGFFVEAVYCTCGTTRGNFAFTRTLLDVCLPSGSEQANK